MTKETYKALPFNVKEKISPINFSFINIGNEFIIDDLAINTFSVYHDATDPIGYLIKDCITGKTLTYITDTGKLEPFDLINNSDAYILESNHEPDLLLMSARPWILKNRIMSEEGHLSNEDSAILFSKIFGDKTRNVMLFHLSNECNTHELALSTYLRYFKKNGIDISNIKITISNQSTPTEIIEV